MSVVFVFKYVRDHLDLHLSIRGQGQMCIRDSNMAMTTASPGVTIIPNNGTKMIAMPKPVSPRIYAAPKVIADNSSNCAVARPVRS